MSTPRNLRLPDGVCPTRLVTPRGEFAALEATHSQWNDLGQAQRSAVLLIPGWTGSKEDFLAILAGIADAGHRAVAIDQRGQYETAGSDDEAAYTLTELGRDTTAIAAGLGAGRVHLLGHSFGGLVARAAVLGSPDTFASLTLLSSGPGAFTAEEQTTMLRLMAEAIPTMGLEKVYDAKRELERGRGLAEPPPEIEAFLRTRFVTNAPVSLAAITRHLVDAPDLVDELAAIGIPKLVVFGEDDDGWPPAVQIEMAKRLSADFEVIAGAGHSAAVDQPDETRRVLATFLAAVDGRQNAPGNNAP
ncbi:alpha/beta fold hydrolase [Flindersiella endophytica]